jgi:XTP/dITP diphosphohydrolase
MPEYTKSSVKYFDICIKISNFAGFYSFIVMKLVFASNNKHKLQEVRQILPEDIHVISLAEVGFDQEIDEIGSTLEQNSQIKAQTIWQWLTAQNIQDQVDGVFADDTGLEITALHGAPGVRTARWAGEEANDETNRQKALTELEGIAERQAQFRTVITLITNNHSLQVEGIVRGTIATTQQGDGGFGYDPVFIPEGYDKTFANLNPEVKNSISHRARAIEALREKLTNSNI